MRPTIVFAQAPAPEAARLRRDLCGRWRVATRAVMILLSLHGLASAQIADLLNYDPATVRRWIDRFNREGTAGLAGWPRPGRPRLGRSRLCARIAALLQRPGPWTVGRLWCRLGRPQMSPRTLYRRICQVAV